MQGWSQEQESTPLIQGILPALLMSFVINAAAEPVVIVARDNPNSTITRETLQQIYLGESHLFPDGMQAIPLDNQDIWRGKFYAYVCHKSLIQIRGWWSRLVFAGGGHPPKEIDGDVNVVKMVAQNRKLIGFVDSRFVNGDVKVIFIIP